jgi:hypothetical protein
MKLTWRTWLWEYGFLIVFVAFLLQPILWALDLEYGWHSVQWIDWPALLISIPWLWVIRKYPRRIDLPEWKEYTRELNHRWHANPGR